MLYINPGSVLHFHYIKFSPSGALVYGVKTCVIADCVFVYFYMVMHRLIVERTSGSVLRAVVVGVSMVGLVRYIN